MDEIFARCVDALSLRGPSGDTLLHVAQAACENPPRAQLLTFLAAQFARRRTLFSSRDWTQPPPALHLTACEGLRRRALGYSALEHPPLPAHAWRVLVEVGRAGPDGVLQAELADIVALSAVMVSHYLGSLSARRLVARKRVVLTKTKPIADDPDVDMVPETGLTEGQPQLVTPTDPRKRITATTVIVLARFASYLASSNANFPPNVARVDPTAPAVQPAPRQTQIVPIDVDSDVAIHELNVNQGADRVLRALQQPPYIRTQKDLKAIALPDHERPKACSVEEFQRRRHRAFRAFRIRLQKAKLVAIAERECIDVNGNARGVYPCLMLVNTPHSDRHDDTIVAPVVIEDDDAVAAVEDIDLDEETQATKPDASLPAQKTNSTAPAWAGTDARLSAEVDLVQQVYMLLREAGADGLSVPQIAAILGGGSKVLSTPQKRIRNIINGMSRYVPITESQKFDGSAMSLKIVLAEFVAAKSKVQKDSPLDDCETQLIDHDKPQKGGRARRTSKMPRVKNQLTSLGIRRRNLLLQLLNEHKAIILETLGRRIAELETESNIDRIDQKVMRRIINDLVLQKKVQVITTLKPSIKKRAQTLRLVTLPGLKADSPEVAHAISVVVAQNFHGRQNKPEPKKTEDTIAQQVDGKRCDEKSLEKDTQKRVRGRPKKSPAGSSIGLEQDLHRDNAETPPSESVNGAGRREAVVVHKDRRNMRNTKVGRLTAIDYGWMKGKMARAQRFHEHLYREVTREQNNVETQTNTLQHTTIQSARTAPALGKFTVQSCLLQMTVADYAAVIGIHQDHEDILQSIQDKKVCEVEDILKDEIASTYASRQLTSLVQALMKLELMKSAQGGMFGLCGSGIVRDFGKGVPPGVLPHGVLFTCGKAVGVFWEELQQFAHYEHQGPLPYVSLGGKQEHTRREAGEHKVADVYIQSRWGKAFAYTFTPHEQLQYEVALQRMVGVKIEMGEKGPECASSFETGLLKRFEAGEILEEAQRLAPALGPTMTRYTNTIAEKLLFYSRFRSQNVLSEKVLELAQSKKSRVSHENEAVPEPKTLESALRLSCASPSVVTPAPGTQRSKKLKNTANPCTDSKRTTRKRLRKREPSSDVAIDLERFTTALHDIVKKRITAYCNDILMVPKWSDFDLYKESKATLVNEHHSDQAFGAESVQANEQEYNRKETEIASQSETSNAPPSHTDDQNPSSRPEGKSMAKDSDFCNVHILSKAVATLCDSKIVQGVIDLVSLQFVLQLKTKHDDCDMNHPNEIVKNALEASRETLANLFRAVVVECQHELYNRHKIVLQKESETAPQLKRHRMFEREFRLTTNMRANHDDHIGDQLTRLVERYRCISNLQARGIMWRHFVFRDDIVDEAMSPSNQDAVEVRPEVLEQVLLCILNSRRQTQKSSPVLSLLHRFRQEDIYHARNRLILRGAINVTTTDTMERYFVTQRGEPGGRETSIRHVLQKKSTKADSWQSSMEREWDNKTCKSLRRIAETKLGQDAAGKKCLESRKAAMALTQMAFFPGTKRRRLQLMPQVGQEQGVSGVKEETKCVDEQEQDCTARKSASIKRPCAIEPTGEGRNVQQIQHSKGLARAWSNIEGKAEEDDTRVDEPKTIVDVTFAYEEIRHFADQDQIQVTSKRVTASKEINDERLKLKQEITTLIMGSKYVGTTLFELLQSRVGQECEKKALVAEVMQELLREGKVQRLSTETPGHPTLPGKEWNLSHGVLYIHDRFISPLVVQNYSTCPENKERMELRLASIWRTFDGGACETLAVSARQSLMNEVTRSPGIEVLSLVQKMQALFPMLPARALLDLLFILECRGAVRMRRAINKKRICTMNGPFLVGTPRFVNVQEEEDTICRHFVDGRGIMNESKAFGKCFVHVVPERSLTEVSAQDLCRVGQLIW